VLCVASASGLGATHKVAAWNTLCSFLDVVSASQLDEIRNVLWGSLWEEAFSLYLHQGHLARPKSSRQLLASLTNALRKHGDAEATAATKKSAAKALVQEVVAGEDHGQAKTCALALSSFLTRDAVSLDEVLGPVPLPQAAPGETKSGAKIQQLLLVLFQWMSKGDFSSTLGQLVAAILEEAASGGGSEDASGSALVWIAPLRETARLRTVDVAALRVHLLPTLLKRSTSDFFAFLQDLGLDGIGSKLHAGTTGHDSQYEADDKLLYAALQAGKEMGVLLETEGGQVRQEGSMLHIPIHSIGPLLQQEPRLARMTGLSLLATSQAATRPISPKALTLIRRNLFHYFADTDANFRSDVFGLVQKLFDRSRAITAVLARQVEKTAVDSKSPSPHPSDVLQYHVDFLKWFRRFLISELRPTASYQHHISALKCLTIFARSGLDNRVERYDWSKSALGETHWPFDLHIIDGSACRLLLDLLVDPFDDIRQIAATILALFPTLLATQMDTLNTALDRAEESMLNTGRADQADGVAHIYAILDGQLRLQGGSVGMTPHLVGELESMLSMAKDDLAEAVERYPVHGLLTSLRYVLLKNGSPSEFASFASRLCSCLHETWAVVKPVLCNDAPEGYLPESFEDIAAEVSTKDTLSYCWRALKEASLLLGTLVSQNSFGDGVEGLDDLCELSFTQLAELRHRGAFSTVAQTWVTCCLHPSSQAKLRLWYDRVLGILRNNTPINTRRSAGLPSLMCGLLVAESSGQLMRKAFGDLEVISRKPVDPAFAQEGSLPQVHAMNCMKDILKNSRLGEESEQHISTALRLAADALRSDAWAVRNCGLMLFRAVSDRLLGTSDAYFEDDVQVKKRLSTEQHPQLLGIVLSLLTAPAEAEESVEARNEGVFPALQLLQRLAIPENRLAEVRKAVKALMGGTSWHIRDKAARTYASFVPHEEALFEVEILLQATPATQNALHGSLLAAKYIMRTIQPGQVAAKDSTAKRPSSVLAIVAQASHLSGTNSCPLTAAAYLDLYCEAMQKKRLSTGHEDLLPRWGHSDKPNKAGLDLSGVLEQLDRLNQMALAENSSTAALLSTPLARLLANQVFLTSDKEGLDVSNRISATITQVAQQDTVAATSFFETACDLLANFQTIPADDRLDAFLDAAATVLDHDGVASKLFCAAQETLLAVAATMRSSEKNGRVETYAFARFAGRHVSQAAGYTAVATAKGQRSSDFSLRLLGITLDYCLRNETVESDTGYRVLSSWAEACCRAVKEEGLYSREAAAMALSEADHIWTDLARGDQSRTQNIFLRLCLAVYDLLNDDDEDPRILASRTTSKILATCSRNTGNVLVPLVASSMLIEFLIQRWAGEPDLAAEALARSLGLRNTAIPSVAERLEAAAQSDNALFAEEKQNLYIDEAREVKVWAQVLLRVPPSGIPISTKRTISRWTYEGLIALNKKARAESDGALGWSTKADTYVIGLQAIYGAELLFTWVARGERIPVPPSAVRRRLIELACATGINRLWWAEIDRVVAKSLIGGLRRTHSAMSAACLKAGVHLC
jgi:hypothetical protein